MREVTTTQKLHTYDELSEEAQARARQWWVEGADTFEVGHIYEDAATIAELFGLDIRQTRKTPTIYYSGFSSQGDGACFEGSYHYKPGALKAVQDYAPQDTRLHRIVKDLQDVQARYFYKLTASTAQSGYYMHSGCLAVSVEHADDQWRDIGDAEVLVTDALRAFADWIYSSLEEEYDYQTSEEAVAENIRCNEYEFTEDGQIA